VGWTSPQPSTKTGWKLMILGTLCPRMI